MQGVNPHMVQFLDLRIRRGHVLEDAIGQVLLLCQQMFSWENSPVVCAQVDVVALLQVLSRRHELKKPLRVVFISNGVQEEGLDQASQSPGLVHYC